MLQEIASAVLHSCGSVVIFAVVSGIPAFIILMVMVFLTKGLSWLISRSYPATCIFDILVRGDKMQEIFWWLIVGVPAITIGIAFGAAYGVPAHNAVWGIPGPNDITESTSTERYILVKISPPKQVYVTLKNEKTGDTFTDIFLGPHCTGYEKNKPGDILTLEMIRKSQNGKTWSEMPDLRKNLCD